MNEPQLTVRIALPDEAHVLERLAQLDSAPRLTGRVLLAEMDGIAVAAISLETGAVTADPFEPTAYAVGVLRLRRYQLTRQGGRRPIGALLRRARVDRNGAAGSRRLRQRTGTAL
jgi:hypothetical protein